MKSEPLEEIREGLDRRTVKRKTREKGFASSNAPNQKEEKMLGVVSWVGSLVLLKQVYD